MNPLASLLTVKNIEKDGNGKMDENYMESKRSGCVEMIANSTGGTTTYEEYRKKQEAKNNKGLSPLP